MANNVKDLQQGSGIRFEFGRAKEARRVFQAVYQPGIAGFAGIKLDANIPKVGDFYSNDFLELRAADIDLEVTGQTGAGESICRITVDYIDTGFVHLQFGSTTATVPSPFDIDGNRASVSYNGDEYVGLIDVEETRMTLEIERVVSINPYETTIKAWVDARENKVNSSTFLGEPARCWRIAQIDAQLLFETYDIGGSVLVDRTYKVTFFLEQRPSRDLELVSGGGTTAVAGWDELKYYQLDGVVPIDATIGVVQLYETADFSTIFAGITF